MVDFRNELREALKACSEPQKALLKRAGLTWDKSSIARRVAGTQPLDARDAVKLAAALGVHTAAVSRVIALADEIGAKVCWTPVAPKIPGRRRAA